MMGRTKAESQTPPRAATLAEKTQWRRADLSRAASSSLDLDEINAPPPSPNNPQFPYPEGPGNEVANPKIFTIMWKIMHRFGVTAFRPNHFESVNSRDNHFLYEVCTVAFIKLYDCGEYKGLTPEEVHPENVMKAIKKYARETLHRKCVLFCSNFW